MNMENLTRLSYEDVNSMASKLGTAAENMQTVLGEVKTLFEQVGDDSTWSGTAANNIKAEFDELSGKFYLFHEAVTACQSHLNTVVENFKAVDSALTGQQQ